jgi:hypothetical protein
MLFPFLFLIVGCGGGGDDPAPAQPTGVATTGIPNIALASAQPRTIALADFFTNADDYTVVSVTPAGVVDAALASDGSLTLTPVADGRADVVVRATGSDSSTVEDTFICQVGGTAQTMTLTADADTTIYEEGELANGGGTHVFVGRTDKGFLRRALVRFDLSGLPAGAVITNAVLHLEGSKTQSGGVVISVHRLTRAWGEGTTDAGGQEGKGAAAANGDATWSSAALASVGWTTPGGDFDAMPSAMVHVAGTGSHAWESAALADDLMAWLEGADNHGWILVADETAGRSTKRFESREAAANQPRVEVEYTAP